MLRESKDIPVVMVSVLDSLDLGRHIAMGAALAPLREEGVLMWRKKCGAAE